MCPVLHLSPYSPETETLTEPGAWLVAGKPSDPPVSNPSGSGIQALAETCLAFPMASGDLNSGPSVAGLSEDRASIPSTQLE